MYDTIVVPIDGSDHAERAAEHGLLLARTCDASVHLLYVVEPVRSGDGKRPQPPVAPLATRGRERVESIRDAIESVDVVDHVAYGTTYRIVRAYVEDHDADLVVVGRRGRTGSPPALGSTTGRLLRVLDVPILTVGG